MLNKLGKPRLDAAQTIFFTNELQHIMAETFEVQYPQLLATSLFPVSREAGPGAESIGYYMFDRVGTAKIVSNYANDWPRVDVFGTKFYAVIRSLGDAYAYNFQEIREAAMVGRPLERMRAEAARQAIEYLCDQLAWNGDVKYGIVGFFRHPNITSYVVRDGAGACGNWAPLAGSTTKTPDEIIMDVNILINTPPHLTQGIERIDTILISPDEYAHIASTPRSGTSDTTILEFLRRVHPQITFVSCLPCADVSPAVVGGGDTTNLMVGYSKNPSKLKLHIPQPFEQLTPFDNGVEVQIKCHERTAGVIVTAPWSVVIAEGI